jgi:hypothetical protein
MIRRGNSINRRASVLMLALLLLVPVALSGHGHAGRQTTSDPCAACAVAHHAPVLHAAPLPALAIAFSCFVTLAASVVAPPRNDVAPHAGRAPPSISPESIA